MKSKCILDEFEELSLKKNITKEELMIILKKYASKISVHDLMIASAHLRKEAEYVQANYREKFLEIYNRSFIMSTKDILENEDYNHKSIIDKKAFEKSFPRFKRTFEKEKMTIHNDDKFPLIYVVNTAYVTFILEEPVHLVGSEYPGGLKIEEINGEYFCPVKDSQKDNINAVCHLCVARQTPDI